MDLPNPVLAKVTERVIARSQKLVLHIYNVLNMRKANSQLVVHSHVPTWLMVLLAWKIMKINY